MTAEHERFIGRCIELARRAEGRTAPNPLVGCVIVDRRGRVIAEGLHAKAGEPHAEAVALAKLGGRAPGATLYVNLEPCAHTKNRRTEPCAPRVADSGVARVVIGMLDPIRSHSGGARALARQGIEVIRNVRRDDCRELNRAWITYATEARPYLTLKTAMTLDGKIATHTGASKWITGPAARKHAHGLRDRRDAILVGVGTVLADDPKLTVRGIRGGRDPVRVIVDSRLRTPPDAAALPANTRSKARCIIATTRAAPPARERRLAERGAEVWRIPGRGKRVALPALMRALGRAELTSVLVEGGAVMHGALIDAGLADELVVYISPKLFGGGGPAWFGGRGVAQVAKATRLRFMGPPQRVGDDLVVTARMR